MEVPFFRIVQLYLPFVFSIFCIILLFCVEKGEVEKGNASAKINLFPFFDLNFFSINLPIKSVRVARVYLICIALISSSILLFYDYSEFFPKHFHMQVFFDKEGIKDSLNAFSKDELQKLGVPENYEDYQNQYYSDLDTSISNILETDTFFRIQGSSINKQFVHCEGQTSFIVEKLSGIQNYYIRESQGELIHILERPDMPKLEFRSFFEKLNTRYDYLSASLKDIFINRSYILLPHFKQINAAKLKSEGIEFHHTVIGLTKIYFLPYPKFSHTVYLYNSDMGLIPIAYAIYR
jgi:hypothetical protein